MSCEGDEGFLAEGVGRQVHGAAQGGPDPGDEDLGAEGLGDVVVRAQLKARDDVRVLALRGAHDDRDAAESRSRP